MSIQFIHILPVILAILMLSMGLTLAPRDFLQVFKTPKAFLIGAFGQMVVLPFIAFGIVTLYPGLHPQFSVGLIIIACCPGGVVSNLFTFFVRGDTALSISLTAIISLLSAFTVPLIVKLSLNTFGFSGDQALSIGSTTVKLFVVTVIPVFIGMGLRRLAPNKVERIDPWMRKICGLLLLVAIVGAIANNNQKLAGHIITVGPIVLIFNVLVLFSAYMLSMLGGLTLPQRKAIIIECGFQNTAMAIMLATSIIGIKQMALPAAFYGILMFITPFIVIKLIKRQQAQ